MTYRSLSLVSLFVLASVLSLGCHSRKAGPENTAHSGDQQPDSDVSSDDALDVLRNSKSTPSPAVVATLKENFQKVLFDFDKSSLTEASRAALDANARLLITYAQVHVQIEGHTDSFGSDEYNLALGDRRARSVYSYLVDSGVSATKLTLLSFGAERRLVPPGSKVTEAPNRRAEFVVLAGADVAGSSDQPGVNVTLEVGS